MIESRANEIVIDDHGKHSPAALQRLQRALAGSPDLVPDPKRKYLYELAIGSCVFYLHVSPISGRVSLLAVWPLETGGNCNERAA